MKEKQTYRQMASKKKKKDITGLKMFREISEKKKKKKKKKKKWWESNW